MGLSRVMRDLTTYGALAAWMWRRYSHAQASDGHIDRPEEVAPPAQETVVVVTDDLTGEELEQEQAERVCFGLDGQTYEIDLSRENAAELRATFGRYISGGRRVRRQKKTSRADGKRGAQVGNRDTAAIL